MKPHKLIIGLGNPGKEYELTRHNLGFLTLDYLAANADVKFKNCSFTQAVYAQDKVNDAWLFKPMTYVNNSGIAVKAFAEYYKISVQEILVVCDDLSLDFGQLRVRRDGSPGGHNGLKSIVDHTHSREFNRLRMGIAHPGQKKGVVDYVLSDFDKDEQKHLKGFIKEAAACCQVWMNQGIQQAMNQYNGRKEKENNG